MSDLRTRLADVIEAAARSSAPWPEDDWFSPSSFQTKNDFRAITLEEFVKGTYLSESDVSDVFRRAALAAADAVAALLSDSDVG